MVNQFTSLSLQYIFFLVKCKKSVYQREVQKYNMYSEIKIENYKPPGLTRPAHWPKNKQAITNLKQYGNKQIKQAINNRTQTSSNSKMQTSTHSQRPT